MIVVVAAAAEAAATFVVDSSWLYSLLCFTKNKDWMDGA